jgi:cytochrome c-type biogenesis protein CcmH
MPLVLSLLALGLSFVQPLQATDLEREARELEAALIAPCCFSQQVSVHHSPAADEVRVDIRRRLAAGETRDQILAAYVAQHGKRILAVPPAEGFDRLLHVLPPIGLLLTAGLLALVFRRFSAARATEPAPARAADQVQDERYRETLDDELRDLD